MIFKARCKDLTTYKDLIDILFLQKWLIKSKACVLYYEKKSCFVKQLWVYLESLSVCIYYFCVSICYLYVDTSTYYLYANNSVRVAQIWLAFHEKRAATIFFFFAKFEEFYQNLHFLVRRNFGKKFNFANEKMMRSAVWRNGSRVGRCKNSIKIWCIDKTMKEKEREGVRKIKREGGRE